MVWTSNYQVTWSLRTNDEKHRHISSQQLLKDIWEVQYELGMFPRFTYVYSFEEKQQL